MGKRLVWCCWKMCSIWLWKNTNFLCYSQSIFLYFPYSLGGTFFSFLFFFSHHTLSTVTKQCATFNFNVIKHVIVIYYSNHLIPHFILITGTCNYSILVIIFFFSSYTLVFYWCLWHRFANFVTCLMSLFPMTSPLHPENSFYIY